ncbi:hypothetical protein TTHERM_00822230 (macronuclear) [Tetrahymena thermophila SB210]|uniref:USP domain-containing protein n=1 Tax=Tetrahymena thermophila (strain SB210) TaxID=312017 RepID=Q22EZ0_TETTS|nr:hypothetical protein TTHERM_00822230 [Tetrahymena thermophila SB210]EAR83885.2 hypothetical protein TTHERM_00822230 [Tetrahymena thermophila SB210]|eukprot:XP_001031548.2 hypothetical protein TTHERM_00822230 [Tetrahymena thermophila SB210]
MAASLALMKKQIQKYGNIKDLQQAESQNNKENQSSFSKPIIQINAYHSQPKQSSYQAYMQKQINDCNVLQSKRNENSIKISNDFLKDLLDKQIKTENSQFRQEQKNKNQNNLSQFLQSFSSSISPLNQEQRTISSSCKKQSKLSINNNQLRRNQSTEKQRPSTSYQPQSRKIVYNHTVNQTDDNQPAISITPLAKQSLSKTFYKISDNSNSQGQKNQNYRSNISPITKNQNQDSQQLQCNNYIIKLQKSSDKQGNKILIVPRKDSGIKTGTKVIRSQSKSGVYNGSNFKNLFTQTEASEILDNVSITNLTKNNSFLQISKYNHRIFESALNEEKHALQVKKSREDFSQITRCNRAESTDIKLSKKKSRNISMHYNSAIHKNQQNQTHENLYMNYLSNKNVNNILFNTPINQKRNRIMNYEITPWDNNQVSQSDILSDVFNQSPKNQFSPLKNSLMINSNSMSQNLSKYGAEQRLINLQKSFQEQPVEQQQQQIQNLQKKQESKTEETTNRDTSNKNIKAASIPNKDQESSNNKPKTPISNRKSVQIRKISEKIEDNCQQKEVDILPMTNYSDVITSKNIFRPLRPVSKNSRREQTSKNQLNQSAQQIQTPFKKPNYRCDKGLYRNSRIASLNSVLQTFRNIPFIREYIQNPQQQNDFIPILYNLYESLDQRQDPQFMNSISQFFQTFLNSQLNRNDNEMNEIEIIVNVIIEQLLLNATPLRTTQIKLTRLANFSQNDEDACDLYEELAFNHQNNELYSNIFGLLKYKFFCQTCMNEDTNLEDFYIFKTLKMEINRFQTDFLHNLYTTGKSEANYCDFCMKDKLFFQKMEFIQLPQLLIIPLEIKIDTYYSNVNSYTSKNVFNQLEIPKEFMITDIYKNKVYYQLLGEIDKIGNTNQYVSICKDFKGNIQQYQDIKVKFIEKFPLESAQVLFYIKQDYYKF